MTKANDRGREHRGASVLGVDGFAHRKGVVKALEGFRERQTKKRLHTSKALRQYEKAMKREGYEAGKGASRRRDSSTQQQDVGDETVRRKKTNPFVKASTKAEKRKVDKEQRERERLEGEERRLRKIKARKERTRLLSKKTRKGQPIMKNVVHDILKKLEK